MRRASGWARARAVRARPARELAGSPGRGVGFGARHGGMCACCAQHARARASSKRAVPRRCALPRGVGSAALRKRTLLGSRRPPGKGSEDLFWMVRGERLVAPAAGTSYSSDGADGSSTTSHAPVRLIQHKKEARLFYAFLSQFYDHIVNPGHWTEAMRADALEPAKLEDVAGDANKVVYDVGGGTGFCTLGLLEAGVEPTSITLLDQSPQQLDKARAKPQLSRVTILEGDAEELPFDTDSGDLYVSSGSIEYWPEPQRGICEAYRVLKPGGMACMIGPVHPTHPISRFFADAWMLFPKEEEYITWFQNAGFSEVKLKRIGPKWYRGCRKHGLIMGCSVTGVKRVSGDSPFKLPERKAEDVSSSSGGIGGAISFVLRTMIGSLAGFYYFMLPIYMWVKDKILPKSWSFE